MATPAKLLAVGLVFLAPAALAGITSSSLPSQIQTSGASVITSAVAPPVIIIAARADPSTCSDETGDYPTISGFWPVQTGPSGKVISGNYAPGGGAGSGSGSGNIGSIAKNGSSGSTGTGSGAYTNGTSAGPSGGRGSVSPTSAAVAGSSGSGRSSGSFGSVMVFVCGLLMLF